MSPLYFKNVLIPVRPLNTIFPNICPVFDLEKKFGVSFLVKGCWYLFLRDS